MRKVGGRRVYSAADLAGHLGCRHRTVLDLEVVEGRRARPPVYPDPVMDALIERGFEHERRYVAALGEETARIEEGDDRAVDATLGAMRRGVPVIVQGTLASDPWMGRTDVLRRVATPSALGAWSYEVTDTKLSAETKATTVLQLALYSDLLADAQGRRPDRFHVVSPDGDGFHVASYRVAAFEGYVRRVKDRLLGWSRTDTAPEPVAACDVCRWWRTCEARLREEDSLWLVAGIRRSQQRDLVASGTTTLLQLAQLPAVARPSRGSLGSLQRTKLQAEMQATGRREGRPVHTLLPVEVGRGLARLPEPSPGDVFLDLEGDRLGLADGREFLFGLVAREDDGRLAYACRWATREAEERAAFEEVIDRLLERAARWPDMHVYHYAPYEPAAFRRLMQRHGTRAEELDRLLRGRRFVDLCAVVKQGMRASVERYSIKDLERSYGYVRRADLRAAGACVQAVRIALGTGGMAAIGADVRRQVEDYNREDCESAFHLREWLEHLRAGLVASGTPVPRPELRDGAPSEAIDERDREARRLAAALLADVPDGAPASMDDRARWLLAQMLDYHRREDKVSAWEFYRLAELDADEAIDEKAALGRLRFVERVGESARGLPIHRYAFPEQDCELRAGQSLRSGEDDLGTIHAFDLVRGTIDIKQTAAAADVHPDVVFGHERYDPKEKPAAIRSIAEAVVRAGLETDGPARAACALLRREPPAVALAPRPGESSVDAACRAVVAMERGVLPVQGPPGAGKTYTAAHMIVALVRAGRRVGVTATGHAVIRQLVHAAAAIAAERGVPIRCARKPKDTDKARGDGPIRHLRSNAAVDDALAAGEVDVLGGTSWLWSRERSVRAVDVLFVDEAGQMSLADALAVSRAAPVLVLVGDPQQLEQPQQAAHPEGADASALGHVLDGHATIAADRGVFLAETWRMAPAITRFTSELFYDGRLRSRPALERQAVRGATRFAGAGLWYVPVEHEGNQSSAPEEVDAVGAIVDELLAGAVAWTDADGREHPLGADDVLVVAPYNAQVRRIEQRVATRGVRVGTVDRFQGQEAAIVIVSMATSTADEAPRGMDFLYSANRLNVATSRARCACILVASPRLFEPECRTPEQIRLANAFCRYLELTGDPASRPPHR